MAAKNNAEEIYSIAKSLIGLKAWNVVKLYGYSSVIDFGKPTRNHVGNIIGEQQVYLQHTYRIEVGNEVIVTSFSAAANSKNAEAIEQIKSKQLEEVEIIEPSLDTVFIFEDNLKVFVYNAYFEGGADLAAWRYIYPVNNVLRVGPGPKYTIDSYFDL
ncbi:MAG: hypothetical protein DWQ07_12045 [Chloroflexi bacterium]|nr:MAG: hypothetical protein DWQ07_12045 [Chloroflexota bacterium]MBL1196090.1 hypothetical protein [Chloroflexota bacterium]NOH13383.1 hypothetical protein [Chloroflexota bacterium]